MKFTKKIAACVLALMLIVSSVAFSVSAADDAREKEVGTNATIIINGSEDGTVSVANKTFDLYRIFDASASANSGSGIQPNVSYTWNIPEGKTQSLFYNFFFTDWKGTGADPFCDATGTTEASSVNKAVEYISGFSTNAAKMSELADDLCDYIDKVNSDDNTENDISPEVTNPPSVSVSNIVYSGLTFGYYLIRDTTPKQSNSDVCSAPILVTAASNATIYLKATKPTINKTIVGLNKSVDEYISFLNTSSRADNGFFSAPQKGISASAGDEVIFAITFNVPDRSDYRGEYTFSIVDNIPSEYTFVDHSLRVCIDKTKVEGPDSGKTTYTKADHPDAYYWVESDGALEFNFDKTNADGSLVYPVKTPVTVLYTCKLSDNAARKNTNTAKLTYSSNPSIPENTSFIESSANVYTYQLVFGKYVADADGNSTGSPLTGAQFELYDESGNIVKFIKSTTENGAYSVSTADTGTVTTLEVLEADNANITPTSTNIDGGKQGQFKILGLGSGNYSLREIKAPDGYALPHNDFKFKIEDAFGTLEGVPTNLTLSFTNLDENKAKPLCPSSNAGEQKMFITIPNLPGSTLPSTGGIGTLIFIGIGIVLMGSCVVYFVIRKKRKNNAVK
ncbi:MULTISPECIES: SpaA isopeptide-forming pilin-related protein [unclassified Ruminococcus]|uniref:SpaA isopeptide-forming pilin-related protein n=1 Tax=unclassified Ruminococcus TaxID=2608920 RepID=UPI0021095FF2|nr:MULTISPECIES: SpaA isopeptide-forming pilin-related protein [unclassified Ruminococcus]